jgi:hypothetical protein
MRDLTKRMRDLLHAHEYEHESCESPSINAQTTSPFIGNNVKLSNRQTVKLQIRAKHKIRAVKLCQTCQTLLVCSP